MKNLVYANSPGRARDVVAWVRAFGTRLPLEVTILRVEGGDAGTLEAARILEGGISGLPGVVSMSVRSREGAPEETIAAEVREGLHDLVTVAPAGRHGLGKLLHGSMVAHVVQRVSASVLVVRDGERVPPRRLVACVSGSRHSLTTVTLAAQLAGLFGAELTLLSVLSQLGIGLGGGKTWDQDPASFLATDDPQARQLRVAAQVASRAGPAPELKVRQGLVSTEIVRQIREGGHDLLVLGTHRAEDFDTVYEDVTDELVQTSEVSTFVVGMRAGLL